MNVAELKKDAEQRMAKAVEVLKVDLAKVRTGRAHTGLLDHVMVEYTVPWFRCRRWPTSP